MIEENDGAVTGGESEVASTDLHSVIADAVSAQKAPQAETPAREPEAVKAEEVEKPQREDGRDEKGRFAPKEPKAEAATEEPAAPVEAEADTPKELDAPAHRPPPGWPVAAKAAYVELPDAVKDAIAKREEEVSAGFARYGGLKQYAEIAERNGTTLANAVADYSRLENQFRTDPVAGVDAICARFGITPNQFLPAYAARHGINLTGQQTTQSVYQQPSVDQDAIKRAIVEQIRQEQLAEKYQGYVEEFLADPSNKFASNVENQMAFELQKLNQDEEKRKLSPQRKLQEAYENACWAHPEIRAILSKSQTQNTTPSNVAAIQKARAAAKAVGGAPSPGFKPDVKTVDTSKLSIMDNIRHAIAQQR